MILLALAILAADPSSLPRVVAAASPGDTVRLVAGKYPTVTIRSRSFDPPLTIDASAATLAGVQILSSSGVTWTGGTVRGDPAAAVGASYGVLASASKAITVKEVHVSDFRVGIVFDHVAGGTIAGNWLSRMTSDGIDLAIAWNVAVKNNACSDFTPAAGSHPDCIQLWSRATDRPTSDIQVTANSVVGSMQGIGLFNTVRDGVNDGGFDRIAITGNTVLNTYADGIALYDCRSCTVRNNSVSSLPNYSNRAQLVISGGSVDQCGNDVPMVPRQATPACRS